MIHTTYLNAVVDTLEPIDNLADLLLCYKDMSSVLLHSGSDGSKASGKGKEKFEKGLSVLVDIVISLQTKPSEVVGPLPECIPLYLFTKWFINFVLKLRQ